MLIPGLSLFVFGLICFIWMLFADLDWIFYLAFIPPITISWYHAYTLLMPLLHTKRYSEATQGVILSIKANGASLGGTHQPLYKSAIRYLDIEKEFNNLSPYFIHNYQPGDTINIKYNPNNPLIAVVEE